MKYYVNEKCIGCGMCFGNCPNVFFMNNEGLAEAVDEDSLLIKAKKYQLTQPEEMLW